MLCPFKSGALAICKERRFAPSTQSVQSLLGLATRIFGVHIEAIGAAVRKLS